MEKRKLIRASACRRTGTLKELQEHPEKTDHFLHGKKKLLYSSDCFWSCLGYLNKPKLPPKHADKIHSLWSDESGTRQNFLHLILKDVYGAQQKRYNITKKLKQNVKHDDGSIVLCFCFSSVGTGALVKIVRETH